MQQDNNFTGKDVLVTILVLFIAGFLFEALFGRNSDLVVDATVGLVAAGVVLVPFIGILILAAPFYALYLLYKLASTLRNHL